MSTSVSLSSNNRVDNSSHEFYTISSYENNHPSSQHSILRISYFKRLIRCEKHACFSVWAVITFIACLIGCIMALVFIPIIPSYSICNQNIQWGSILQSITTLGYPSANVTFHTSLYNPNKFTIELRRLQLSFYYKGDYFGNAAIAYEQNQTPTFDNNDKMVEFDQNLFEAVHYDPKSSSERQNLRSTDRIDLNIPFQNNTSLTSQQNSPSTVSPPSYRRSSSALNQTTPLYPSLNISTPRPTIQLQTGSITDVYLDAIIEPSLSQALEMARDYTNAKLFVAVRVQYETSVYAWYTPRINYNATSQFDNIDIGSTLPSSALHSSFSNNTQSDVDINENNVQYNAHSDINDKMVFSLFGHELPSIVSFFLDQFTTVTHFDQEDIIHIRDISPNFDEKTGQAIGNSVNKIHHSTMTILSSSPSSTARSNDFSLTHSKDSSQGDGAKNYCKCGGDY